MRIPVMSEWEGCLGVVVLVTLFWGIIIYLVIHPSEVENIPWFIAGVCIAIILKRYHQERRK